MSAPSISPPRSYASALGSIGAVVAYIGLAALVCIVGSIR
jgi:hypothetical protein